VTSIDCTAYPTLKRMAPRNLAEAFTLPDEKIDWARDKTSPDPYLLALAVWLKFNELVANCAIYSTALDITGAPPNCYRRKLRGPSDCAR
jgi:hypothetical protein